MPRTFDLEAWRFFHAQTASAVTAAALARAERVASERGWEVAWMDDPEGTIHWYCADGCQPATVETAVLYVVEVDDDNWPVGDPRVLESLSGVDDASPAYRRVVAADLAWAALLHEPAPVPPAANEFSRISEIGPKTYCAAVAREV